MDKETFQKILEEKGLDRETARRAADNTARNGGNLEVFTASMLAPVDLDVILMMSFFWERSLEGVYFWHRAYARAEKVKRRPEPAFARFLKKLLERTDARTDK